MTPYILWLAHIVFHTWAPSHLCWSFGGGLGDDFDLPAINKHWLIGRILEKIVTKDVDGVGICDCFPHSIISQTSDLPTIIISHTRVPVSVSVSTTVSPLLIQLTSGAGTPLSRQVSSSLAPYLIVNTPSPSTIVTIMTLGGGKQLCCFQIVQV